MPEYSYYRRRRKIQYGLLQFICNTPMMVDVLQILVQKKMAQQQDYDLAIQRMVRHAEFQERIIITHGTFPAFSHSITYRTAAFQVLAQTALMEKLPAHLSPAQVRCRLTAIIPNVRWQPGFRQQWLVGTWF